MHAQAPSYQPASDALQRYRARHERDLDAQQRETLYEVARRLEQLDEQAHRLIEQNNAFMAGHTITKIPGPEGADTIVVRLPGALPVAITTKRADPNIPVEIGSTAGGGAYHVVSERASAFGVSDSERRKYESEVEAYYYNAHRVLDLLRETPGLGKLQSRAITIVRNKLVEHPTVGAKYSFGFGSAGPVVRPMGGAGGWRDDGLVPNTEAFITDLTRMLDRA